MARRRDPGSKEYSPLDDAKGRLPIEEDLVRDVIGDRVPAPATVPEELRPQLTIVPAPPVEAAVSSAPAAGAPAAGVDERPERPMLRNKSLVVEKLTKYNKFLTTPREKLELERLSAHVSGALGVSVKPSQLIRACLIQLLHAEHDIIRRAGQHPEPKRPSNTEAVALAEFDNLLAELLSQAFRDAGPMKFRK
jgi:hypothetical protein